MSDENESTGKQPTHYLYQVNQRRDGKTYENYVGSGFPAKSGVGTEVRLASLPVDGRVMLYTAEERLSMLKQGKQQEHAGPAKDANQEKDQERGA